jgi:hypothetical protein
LAKDLARLSEVMESLEQIGPVLDELGKQAGRGDDEHALEVFTRLRVPGFFAYTIAEEAYALLKAISARAALTQRRHPRSAGVQRRIDTIIAIVDAAQPTIEKTLVDMKPWQTADARVALEKILDHTKNEASVDTENSAPGPSWQNQFGDSCGSTRGGPKSWAGASLRAVRDLSAWAFFLLSLPVGLAGLLVPVAFLGFALWGLLRLLGVM